jgi:hypothetical protein
MLYAKIFFPLFPLLIIYMLDAKIISSQLANQLIDNIISSLLVCQLIGNIHVGCRNNFSTIGHLLFDNLHVVRQIISSLLVIHYLTTYMLRQNFFYFCGSFGAPHAGPKLFFHFWFPIILLPVLVTK